MPWLVSRRLCTPQARMRLRYLAEYMTMRKTEVSLTNVLIIVLRMPDDGRRQTVDHRQPGIDNFCNPPSLEYTELVLIERRV